MLLGIDHLVIAVADLEEARRRYEALGFTVVPGGRHPVGTHNALVALEDGAYLELIAFYAPNPQHRWWEPLRRGGGLVDYCLATDDLPGDAEALRRAGVAMADPTPLSRVRPDGYQVKWRLAIPRPPDRGVAPFLIEDETPRAERVPSRTDHANRVRGIAALTVAVPDVARPQQWYARVLGTAGEAVRRDDLAAAGVRFRVGPHALEFLAPTGAGPLADWLAQRGASPFAATLWTAATARGPLDPAQTLGARLALVGAEMPSSAGKETTP